MGIIEIKKQRYTQAMIKVTHGANNKYDLVPSYNEKGDPIYALPGGGRATCEQIEQFTSGA